MLSCRSRNINNFSQCVGDNVVVSKLTSALKIEVMFVLDGHMTNTDWYIYTCQYMNMYARHTCFKGM